MDTKTLAQRIAARRKELGFSRDDLATALGITGPAIQQWESGESKNLKLSNLCALADALNVNVRWLAEGKGPKDAAANFDAYTTALSRRDESDSEDKRRGWERIAAVFAKAAAVLLLVLPPLPSQRAYAGDSSLNIINVACAFSRQLSEVNTHCTLCGMLRAVLVRAVRFLTKLRTSGRVDNIVTNH